MIPFFVGYALLVWYFVARYRRSLRAFAYALAGIATLVGIGYLHWLLGHYHPEFFIQGLQMLLYPYTVMVGAVALFIAGLPRRTNPGACVHCGYNLIGLGYPVAHCPECGHKSDVVPPYVYRPSGLERGDLRGADRALSPAHAAHRGAGEQDDARHDAQQHPAEG